RGVARAPLQECVRLGSSVRRRHAGAGARSRPWANQDWTSLGLCPRAAAWSGPEPPAAVYLFAPDRKAERPASHLANFKGVLHVDGYAGFEQLAEKEDVVLAACWSHSRRKFYEVVEATGSPVAAEALRRIAELYAIEAELRGQTPAHRLAARCNRAK